MLFLDEPTTGLDPRARSQVWETIRGVVAGGATVLLTTQYLEEADELADRIAVIDRGLVVADGTPAELKSQTGGQTLVVRAADRTETGQVAAIVADVTGAAPEISDETGLVTAPASKPGPAAGRGPPAGRGRPDGRRAGVPAAQPGRGVLHPDRPPR